MFGIWLGYVINGLNIWEMALLCRKRLQSVGNDLDMWRMTEICLKRLKCVWNGLDMC